MVTTAESVGRTVRDLRTRLSLTQEEVAERAHVSRQWIIAFESGRKPRAELDRVLRTLEALAPEEASAVLRSRSDRFARNLHLALVPHLVADSDSVLRLAEKNQLRMREAAVSDLERRWLDRWGYAIRDRDFAQLVDYFTRTDEMGHDLRQMSPFTGILSEGERRQALAAAATIDA